MRDCRTASPSSRYCQRIRHQPIRCRDRLALGEEPARYPYPWGESVGVRYIQRVGGKDRAIPRRCPSDRCHRLIFELCAAAETRVPLLLQSNQLTTGIGLQCHRDISKSQGKRSTTAKRFQLRGGQFPRYAFPFGRASRPVKCNGQSESLLTTVRGSIWVHDYQCVSLA